MYFCFLSLFLTQSTTENLWFTKLVLRKKLDPWNTQEKITCTNKIHSRKSLGPTKFTREKNLDPHISDSRNTHEGITVWQHMIQNGTSPKKFRHTQLELKETFIINLFLLILKHVIQSENTEVFRYSCSR